MFPDTATLKFDLWMWKYPHGTVTSYILSVQSDILTVFADLHLLPC